MNVFDRVDPVALENRQLHLSILAISMILILFTGMALLMFPAVFSNPVVLSGITLRETFFGFCVLGVLLVGYLIDRQFLIAKLRQRIAAEENQINHIRQEASVDLLENLPGLDHFRDCLAMDFRRAFNTGLPLSVLVMELKPSKHLVGTGETTIAFGDAAKAAIRKLRAEDTLYCFGTGVFGVVLPGTSTENAFRVQERVCDGLRDASGASERFTFQTKVLNYPDHAGSVREMGHAAECFLPRQKVADLNVLFALRAARV